jgi:hypothetical protein
VCVCVCVCDGSQGVLNRLGNSFTTEPLVSGFYINDLFIFRTPGNGGKYWPCFRAGKAEAGKDKFLPKDDPVVKAD